IASLTRDIICFVPLVILLPHIFETNNPGTGINGILFAAPAADLIAMIVVIALTVPYFKSLGKDSFMVAEKDAAVIKPSHKGAIITISREHGSAGKEIGKKWWKSWKFPSTTRK
ncbi:MAG: hypothetical protein ACOYI4_09185, partial [Christensenellales bacterium]